jgi:hypothetical protein
MVYNNIKKIVIIFFLLFNFFFINYVFSSENDKNTKIRKYIQNNKVNITFYDSNEFSKIAKFYKKIDFSTKKISYRKIFDSLYFFDFDHKLINSVINFKVTFNKDWKIYFVQKDVDIKNLEWNIKYIPFYLFFKLQSQEFIELNDNFHLKTANNFNNWYIDETIKNYETTLGIIYFIEHERIKTIFFISFFSMLIIFLLYSIRSKLEK